MIKEVEISIWDQVVGYAAYGDNRLVSFEYDDKFSEHYDLAPLMMPRSKKRVYSFDLNEATYHGLPGLLADSLPDKYGTLMINSFFYKQGIKLGDVTALDRLCYLGKRAMGALEFNPAHNLGSDNELIDIENLVDISAKILQDRLDFEASLDDISSILQIGSSAGGARAKAVIALNPITNEIRTGQAHREGFESWLIKLDGVTNNSLGDPQGYTNIEYAYYLMAKDCGIEIMPSKLLHENCRSHFLTKRFDRKACGEKIHVQTLCALAHLDFNQARVHSYEILFRVANRLNLKMNVKEQLFKRMVFNVVGRNHDDHTKNFSFMMDQDAVWKLAPAYDLTFAYNPSNYWLKEHNLLINGKSSDITKEDLMQLAKEFKIEKAQDIIESIIEVFSCFKGYALEAGLDDFIIKTIVENLVL